MSTAISLTRDGVATLERNPPRQPAPRIAAPAAPPMKPCIALHTIIWSMEFDEAHMMLASVKPAAEVAKR